MAGRMASEAERHRERQRRYRERLRAEREPERDDISRAAWRAIQRAHLRILKDRDSGRVPEDPRERRERAFAERWIERLKEQVVIHLANGRGYSRERAERRLRLALIPEWPGPRAKDD